MSEETLATAGTPTKGFIEKANVVSEAMASASIVVAQGAPTESPIPLFEPISTEESTQAEKGCC